MTYSRIANITIQSIYLRGQIVRRPHFISIAFLLLLFACSDIKDPSNAHFTKAINQYLANHGELCTVIGRQFPIDVPQSEQKEQFGIGPKLVALEQAGLVNATDTIAVVHGMLEPPCEVQLLPNL